MKLVLYPACSNLRVMNVYIVKNVAVIDMTNEGLLVLRRGLMSWLAGREDFGVSPGHSPLKPAEFGSEDRSSLELWFWGPGYCGP